MLLGVRGSAGKESTCNAEDLGSTPGEGKGYPLQYSGLENSMDRIVHGVAKSDTTEQLSFYPTLYRVYFQTNNTNVVTSTMTERLKLLHLFTASLPLSLG